jgi:hypothetical protein
LVDSNTHTFLFEAKKSDADNAFRNHKGSRTYKTLSVKNRVLCFSTNDLQAQIAEYNNITEEYQRQQAKVVGNLNIVHFLLFIIKK